MSWSFATKQNLVVIELTQLSQNAKREVEYKCIIECHEDFLVTNFKGLPGKYSALVTSIVPYVFEFEKNDTLKLLKISCIVQN